MNVNKKLFFGLDIFQKIYSKMNNESKFVLPSPNFNKIAQVINQVRAPYLTPCGMNLLPREKQPPPMYGPRGATIPARFLKRQSHNQRQQVIIAKIEDKKNEQFTKERQYCEACEMELQSPEDLRIHKSQHEPCPVEGCRFKGHPNVMDKHVMLLHASGLFDKFKKLSTPEEIAAWREERKKRYPTVANVLMKQKAKEQRQQRGERLDGNKKRFGNPKDRKRAHNHNSQQETQYLDKCKEEKLYPNKFKEKNSNNNRRNKKAANNSENKKKESSSRCKVKTFEENNPIKSPATKDVVTKVVEEDIQESKLKFKGTKCLNAYRHIKPKQIAQNALSSLLAAYCSESESSLSESEESDDNSSLNHNQKTDIPIKNPTENTNISEEFIENHDEHNVSKIDPSCSHLIGVKIEPSQESEVGNLAINISSELIERTILAKTPSTTKIYEQFAPNHQSNSQVNTNTSDETENASIADNSENASKASTPILKLGIDELIVDSIKVPQGSISSSDEGPEEAPIAHTSSGELKDCSFVTTNTVANVPPPNKKPDFINRLDSIRRKRKLGLDYRNAKSRKQNTMLEKLLEPDIRHERNVLLQCVRFVCQNNFFGIGAKKD